MAGKELSTRNRRFLQRLQRQEKPVAHRALTAAAMPINLASKTEARRMRVLRQGWQNDAAAYADSIPELSFAYEFLGNASSRMRYFPACVNPEEPDGPPIPIAEVPGIPQGVVDVAHQAMSALGIGRQAVAPLQKSLSWQLGVPGEAFLVGMNDPQDGDEQWSIRSIDEFMIFDDTYKLREVPLDPQGTLGWIPLDPATTYAARLWNPWHRFNKLATSPMRALLDVSEELLLLSRDVRSVARSRLTGGGILKIPEGLRMAPINEDDDDPESEAWFGRFAEAMMTPISDDGVASAVVPIGISGDPESLAQLDHLIIDRPYSPLAIELRAEAIGRIATGLDFPREILEGIGDVNHWQQDELTEVFIQGKGWCRHQQVEVGDQVLAFHVEGGTTSYETVAEVLREEVVDRDVVSMEGRYHSSLTSYEHRWPVWHGDRFVFCQSKDLINNPQSGPNKAYMVLGAPYQSPVTPEFTDAEVAVMAWLSTDADVYRPWGGRERLRIRQRNAENVAALRGIVAGFDHVERHDESAEVTVFELTADETERWLSLGERLATRWVPTLSVIQRFTRSQLELFLVTCERANGGTKAKRTVFAIDPARLAPVEHAAVLAGYRTTIRQRNQQHGFGTEPVWRITWGTRTLFAPNREHHITETTYTGTLWCLSVPVGKSFLARRNGHTFFTGNSGMLVSDETFRHHIEPQVIKQVDCMSAGYLRVWLTAAGIPKYWVDRICVWYDPVDLISKPDPMANAVLLHDRFAISNEALRDAGGFKESDQPGALEIEFRMLQKTRTFPPNMVEAIFHKVDPELAFPPINTSGTIPGIGPQGEIPAEAPQPAAPAAPALPPSAPLPASPAPALPPEASATPPMTAPTEAFATPPNPTHVRLSRKLTEIDSQLRARIQVAACAAMTRLLDKAGAKLRTRAADRKFKDSEVKTLVAGQPDNRLVASTIGPALVASLGFTTAPELLSADWSELKAQFMAWTEAAQKQALRVAMQLAGITTEDESYQAADLALSSSVAPAWEVMEAALNALAEKVLYTPDGDLDPGAAFDPNSVVPMGVVRNALTIAGGTPPPDNVVDVSQPVDVGTDPAGAMVSVNVPGQIGNGDAISTLLDDSGMQVVTYEWIHGSGGQHSFEPHEDLDGVPFANFDDDVLLNPGDWPDVSHFSPGDHFSCTCDAASIYGPGDSGPDIRPDQGPQLSDDEGGSEPVSPDAGGDE